MSVKKKLVISRDIGQRALSLLGELDPTEWEIVLWREDRPASRKWLEEHVPTAIGLLVLLTDRVCDRSPLSSKQLKAGHR